MLWLAVSVSGHPASVGPQGGTSLLFLVATVKVAARVWGGGAGRGGRLLAPRCPCIICG